MRSVNFYNFLRVTYAEEAINAFNMSLTSYLKNVAFLP